MRTAFIYSALLLLMFFKSVTNVHARSTYSEADIFSPPMGYADNHEYGPFTTTDYDVQNPNLSGNTCFGEDWSIIFHAGEDWFRQDGNTSDTADAEVTAIANGTVLWSAPINYPGRVVIIEHEDVLSNGFVYSVYSHLDPSTLAVTNGDNVLRHQQIGTVLDQGTNSHLHFEIRFFDDGSDIYPETTSCNGVVPGRGYTYPEHPDDFPTPSSSYTDPSTFVGNRRGVMLPIIFSVLSDTYEPNNSSDMAYPVVFNQVYESYIWNAFDQDWYEIPTAVAVGEAKYLDVYLESIPPDSYYYLQLYNESGVLLGESTQPPPNDQYIRAYITEGGTYRISVTPANGSSSQSDSYELRVLESQAPTTQ